MKKLMMILSIISAWIFALSDYLLDMKSMFGAPFYSVFNGMPLHIMLYATFCLFAFPFLGWGLIEIFKRTNLQFLGPWISAFLATVPIFMHTSFLYYYFIVNDLGAAAIPLLNKIEIYKNFIGILYFIGVAVISACLFYAVITGRSSYPKSFAWLNPLLAVIVLSVLKFVAPSFASVIYPLLVPATILALLMSLYLIYDFKHMRLDS